MDITSLGHSSYRIKGKSATIVIDPFDGTMVGFPYPKHVAADILLITHEHADHNAVSAVEGSPYVIQGPGEYDIKGVSIIGISSYHDTSKGAKRGKNVLYHMAVDGVNIAHLGDLGYELSTTDIELLDGVDILMIPVGGEVTIGANEASHLISEIEPSIVIPMHYKTAKHSESTFGKLAPVSQFLKVMGKEDVQPTGKLSTTKDKLPSEMQVVVLE